MAYLMVLEDEPALREEMTEYLLEQGHQVVAAETVAEFRRLWPHHRCDIALIDLGLPDGDGLDLVTELRRSSPDLGLIVLTARAHTRSRVAGFDSGADHYLTKPTRLAELSAVIQALWRRIGPRPGHAIWRLDGRERTLHCAGGETVKLSAQDYVVLRRLVEDRGRPVSRQQIVEALGEDFLTYDQRRLDTQMLRLRRKVRDYAKIELPVRTVHGKGYVFTDDVSLGS